MKGLRELDVEIIECKDDSGGISKYINLFKKHWKIGDNYDYLIVGYPGHAVVWFAKLLSGKPVIFDALCTMEEGVLISRGQYGKLGLKALYIKFIDWLAVKRADIVLVESKAQRNYLEKKFGASSKYKTIYTGADDAVFYLDKDIKKNDKFTVLFRGKFLPEAGIKYIVEAAKILENKDVRFLIIGNGFLEKEIKLKIENLRLKNLHLISHYISLDDLRNEMLQCHVSLGQFGDHRRLERTIPHKCYESLALNLPYITAKADGVLEILEDGKNCLFVEPANPQDLAKKILMLKNDPVLAKKLSENGLKMYKERFTPKILAGQILNLLK